MRPLVAITPDLVVRHDLLTARVTLAYSQAVWAAGGTPVVLSPEEGSPGKSSPGIDGLGESTDIGPGILPSTHSGVRTGGRVPEYMSELIERFDAFVLTGGDDPRIEPFGEPTDPRTTPVHPVRQAFETDLLRALETRAPDRPVLGVCLGMQMMALVAGGSLEQYMPESCQTATDHWEHTHRVIVDTGTAAGHHGLTNGSGEVHSKHKQAVRDPGDLTVCARAGDGVIEAIYDPARRFYVGVQWHPERTASPPFGQQLFDQLVAAARDCSPSSQ